MQPEVRVVRNGLDIGGTEYGACADTGGRGARVLPAPERSLLAELPDLSKLLELPEPGPAPWEPDLASSTMPAPRRDR